MMAAEALIIASEAIESVTLRHAAFGPLIPFSSRRLKIDLLD
jgi:hypothetical protein